MVEANPCEEDKCQDVNDALTEKLTEVTNAANEISNSQKAFSEVKSFANPPKMVCKVICALHAFKADLP